MAKLVTTKEKYGVSVGARIAPELAQEIAAHASALGLSMAKMLSLIITKGFSDMQNGGTKNSEYKKEIEETIQGLIQNLSDREAEINSLTETYKTATAEFIASVSDDAESMEYNIDLFNQILESKRNEHDY